MSEDKDSAALDPSSSPGGLNERKLPVVRRINNMPLFVGIGAVSVVLVVFLYVIMDRASQQQAAADAANSGPAEESAKNITKATLSYNELVSGVGDGLIPSADGAKPAPAAPVEPEPAAAAPKPLEAPQAPVGLLGQQGDPLGVSRPKGASDGLNERQRERIAQTKAQRAETAIFAGTSVDFSAVSGQGTPEERSRDRARTAIDEYREKLATVQSFLGQQGEDGGSVPDFFGGDEEGAATSTDSAFLGDSQSDWRLGSTRQASERFAVKSGGIIPAIMISGINSDLPGQVIAQVSENIYDTAGGYDLLIPQGTRLVGSYNSDVLFGQSRVMLRWDRLIFPDASTLDLQGMAGADQMGYSGFKDKVNNHYWRIFGNAFMLSLISAGYQQSLPDENNNNLNNTTTAREQIAISMAENFNEVGSELIRKNLNIQPTIEIRPGYKFNVMINKDIVFGSSYTKMAFKR